MQYDQAKLLMLLSSLSSPSTAETILDFVSVRGITLTIDEAILLSDLCDDAGATRRTPPSESTQQPSPPEKAK